jgi:hypothetical protein
MKKILEVKEHAHNAKERIVRELLELTKKKLEETNKPKVNIYKDEIKIDDCLKDCTTKGFNDLNQIIYTLDERMMRFESVLIKMMEVVQIILIIIFNLNFA